MVSLGCLEKGYEERVWGRDFASEKHLKHIAGEILINWLIFLPGYSIRAFKTTGTEDFDLISNEQFIPLRR